MSTIKLARRSGTSHRRYWTSARVSLTPTACHAGMYKPGTEMLYPALFAAHVALDAAVEQAYGLEPDLEEKDLVAHLFGLYSAAVGAA